jgi:hypothetical protein
MMTSLLFLAAPAAEHAGDGDRVPSAMQQLGAHSRAEAVRVAEDKGWL